MGGCFTMERAPEQPRSEEPCDERIDKLAEDVGHEIAKAWTDQETEGEALARIDELVATAAGTPEPEGSIMDPEEAQRLLKEVDTWHPATKSLADRPPLPDLQRSKGNPGDGKH